MTMVRAALPTPSSYEQLGPVSLRIYQKAQKPR